jgi:hypothetical protein
MKFFYILISLYLPLLSKSQDTTIFAPSGSTFYYSTWVQVPYPELLTFVSEGDTLLNGIQARILRFYQTEEETLIPVPALDKFVYTSGNKIYYWVEDDFYLLYDFGAKPGDTIQSRVEDFPHSLSCWSNFDEGPFDFSYVIDSVGIMTIDGSDLRTQYVTPVYEGVDNLWIIDNPIVERLGTYAGPGYWWGRGEGCALGGFPGGLRCYIDQDLYFKNPYTFFNLECDYISATEEIEDHYFNIHPNPTNDIINLPLRAKQFYIYDMSGRKFSEGKNVSKISLRSLPSNTYVIHYKIENNWIAEKIIKN